MYYVELKNLSDNQVMSFLDFLNRKGYITPAAKVSCVMEKKHMFKYLGVAFGGLAASDDPSIFDTDITDDFLYAKQKRSIEDIREEIVVLLEELHEREVYVKRITPEYAAYGVSSVQWDDYVVYY